MLKNTYSEFDLIIKKVLWSDQISDGNEVMTNKVIFSPALIKAYSSLKRVARKGKRRRGAAERRRSSVKKS